MPISVAQWRASVGQFTDWLSNKVTKTHGHTFNINNADGSNVYFTCTKYLKTLITICIYSNNINFICLVLLALLLEAGDIHTNPGPEQDTRNKNFSFCHINARSLLAGVDTTKHIPSQKSLCV